MKQKLIFISIPTAGTVRSGELTVECKKKLAQLRDAHPDCTFIVPMLQDYQLLPYMENCFPTWENWGKHCKRLILVCNEVWVLKYQGWDMSVGVEGEVEYATEKHIPVVFIDPAAHH